MSYYGVKNPDPIRQSGYKKEIEFLDKEANKIKSIMEKYKDIDPNSDLLNNELLRSKLVDKLDRILSSSDTGISYLDERF